MGKPVSHRPGWSGPGPRLVLGQPFLWSGCWLQGGHTLLRSEVLQHSQGLICLGQRRLPPGPRSGLAAEHSGVLGPKVCLSPQLVVTPGRMLGSRLPLRAPSSTVPPPASRSPLPPGDPLPHPGGFGRVPLLCLPPWFAPSPEQSGPTRLHLQPFFFPRARQHLALETKGFPLSPVHPRCVLSSQCSIRIPGSLILYCCQHRAEYRLASVCHIAEVSVAVVSLQELVCEARGT